MLCDSLDVSSKTENHLIKQSIETMNVLGIVRG